MAIPFCFHLYLSAYAIVCRLSKKYLILPLLFVSCSVSASQTDSLETVLYTKSEKGRIAILRELVPQLMQTNTMRARSFSIQLLEFSKKFKDEQSEADALNFLSEINMLTVMDFSKATDYAERALQLNEKLNFKKGLGYSYSNLGEILYKQNNYPKAMTYFYKSRSYSGGGKDLARSYNQIAKTFAREMNLDSAHYYYSQSLQLYSSAHDNYNVARVTNNLADFYLRQNKTETAKALLMECISLAHKSAPRMEALAYTTLAEVEAKNSDYKKALEYADMSNTVATRLKITSYMLNNYRIKADILTKLKRYEEALVSFNQYNNLKDTLFNAKNSQIVAEYESSLALNKKQKEIDSASEELRKQSSLQNYLIAGIVFVSLVIILLIILIRNSNRKSLEIEKQDEEIHQSNKNIILLNEIGKEITSTLDLEKIFLIIYNRVNELMDAGTFGIGLYSSEKHTIDYRMAIQDGKHYKPYSRDTLDKNQLPVWCIENKTPVFINDVDTEYKNYITGFSPIEFETDGEEETKIHSYIYIPLFIKKEVQGIITVQSVKKNAYTENDLRLISAIASYSSIAIQNSNMFNHVEEMVNHRTYQLSLQKDEVDKAFKNIKLLSEIGQEISSSLNLEEILQTIYTRVNSLMDATAFLIGIYNEKEQKAEGIFGIEKSVRLPFFSSPLNSKSSYASWCFIHKKEIFINDTDQERALYIEGENEVHVGEKAESLIYIPLLVNEKAIGYITAQSFRKNAYTERDLNILRTISSYASAALYNSKLYAGLEDKVNERTLEINKQKEEIETAYSNITILSEIGQEITSTLDLDKILLTIYERVNELMDASVFGIGIHNKVQNRIDYTGAIEKGEKLPFHSVDMNDKSRLEVLCVLERTEILINDYQQEYNAFIPDFNVLEPSAGELPESVIYLPLLSLDKVIGVITVQSFHKNTFSNYHLNVLRSMAVYISIALNNSEAYKDLTQSNLELGRKSAELKESYKNITILAEIGQQITSTLDLDKVLSAVYENVNKLMDAASFVIGYYNRKKQIIEWKLGIEKGEIFPYAFYDMADKNRLAVWCVDHKKEIFINDYNEEHTLYIQKDQPMVAGEDTQSVIYIPLIVDNNVVGTMSVQSFEKNAYTLQHLELLRTLASYAAVALNNSEAYHNLNESNLQLGQKSAELEQKKKEIEESNKNLTLLTELGKEITATLSVEKIIEKVYSSVNTLMDANGFGMGIYNEAEGTLDFPGFIENGERLEFHSHSLDENRLAILCFNHNQEIVIHDYSVEAPDYLFEVLPPVVGQDALSIIYLPLISKEKIIGVISVQSFNKNAYTNYHVELLRNLGVYSAIAIENASLYGGMENAVRERTSEVVRQKEEIERTYNDIKLLSEIGQQITSTLDLDTIFYKLYENVNRLMDAEVFGVRILHAELNSVEYKFEIESGVRMPSLSVSMDNKDNFSVWCIKNRKEIFVNDLQKEYSRFTKKIHVVSGEMPHSNIFYPLIIGEKVLGAITCQSFKKNTYTKFHLNILKTLASYTAIALDNANAYQELQNVMKKLQSTPQLIQAEKMSSLGQLTAGIAHEINNPVNFISANIQPLRQDIGDIFEILNTYEQAVESKNLKSEFSEVEELKSKLDVVYVTKEIEQLLAGIEEGARRTTEIVKGLRNFSRLDESLMKKTNVHEGIENTLTLLNTRFKNRIDIIKNYEDLPDIECFPGQLNQVFMNILSNAIHAIDGPGTINIQTFKEAEGIKIKIRDSGSGMPEEVKRKIFDPFFTTKDVGVGTGLGLSISFGIIEKHKGKIEVESEPGKGSEFIISLPF